MLLLLAGLLTAVPPKPSDVNLTAWFEMGPGDFGCYLERTFGVKDKQWGCTAPEPEVFDDPCKEPELYRADTDAARCSPHSSGHWHGHPAIAAAECLRAFASTRADARGAQGGSTNVTRSFALPEVAVSGA